jgi:ESCRT-II complex subunit VPS22
MCAALGVDPLLSSSSGPVSKGGGGVGAGVKALWGAGSDEGSIRDFYFSLGVRVVEVCRATRLENGGMMSLEEVRTRIIKRSADVVNAGSISSITPADIRQAVEALSPLGSGFSIVVLAGTEMIRSVPSELNTDQGAVLEVITVLGGWVTESVLRDNLKWEQARVQSVLGDLMGEGLIWVDEQAVKDKGEWEYWSPMVITEERVEP